MMSDVNALISELDTCTLQGQNILEADKICCFLLTVFSHLAESIQRYHCDLKCIFPLSLLCGIGFLEIHFSLYPALSIL